MRIFLKAANSLGSTDLLGMLHSALQGNVVFRENFYLEICQYFCGAMKKTRQVGPIDNRPSTD